MFAAKNYLIFKINAFLNTAKWIKIRKGTVGSYSKWIYIVFLLNNFQKNHI